MIRRVERELLDDLPPDHPDAIRERNDLIRINAWMGNVCIMTRALGNVQRGRQNTELTLVELGAGDGEFLWRVAKRMSGWSKVTATLVDQQSLLKPVLQRNFAEIDWHVHTAQSDVFEWLRNGSACDVMIANLFLHHFTEAQLCDLFARAAASTKVFIAVEPRRRWQASLFCKGLWMIGCGAVTQHDAAISVRAGFSGRELSQLWPDRENWDLVESSANLCSHLFVARRKGA